MKKILVLSIIIVMSGYFAKAQKDVGASTPMPTNFPDTLCSDLNDNPSNPLSPYWIYEPYKIYTSCPQIKVGIGLTNPFYLLDVNGTARAKDIKTKKVSIGASYNDNMATYIGELPSQPSYLSIYSFNYGADDLIRAGKSFSYFGMGGVNPYVHTYFRVDRFGTIITKISNNKPHFIATDNNNNEVFKIENKGAVSINNKSNAAPLTIKANNGNKILQLENSGLLRARRIKVDTDNWADYVFVNGYKLLPLQEVAEFIKKNGHLPKIPSAKFLQKHGIDINKMLMLQMEKIEELTLYTIEQENKIEQLSNKVNDLEKELMKIKTLLQNK